MCEYIDMLKERGEKRGSRRKNQRGRRGFQQHGKETEALQIVWYLTGKGMKTQILNASKNGNPDFIGISVF